MMYGGKKRWLVALSFAAAGCASGPTAVEIRPIADPAAKLRAGPDRLADAKGQLAIGNVGLALEGFRKASREDPNNADALVGMAACYELMGRFDVAQSNYEAALAISPRNANVLAKLASALDRQGKAAAAGDVRAEIAQLASASAALEQAQAEPEASPVAAVAAADSVTVALPEPVVEPPKTVARPVIAPAPKTVAPAPAVVATVEHAPVPEPALPQPRISEPAPVALNAPALTVLAAGLAPINIAPLVAMAIPETKAAPVRRPQPARAAAAVQAATVASPKMRLERLSLGEVALLTGTGPVWRGQVVSATPTKVSVRWVPMSTASVARPNIRLLNAARVQGLAARNREYLIDRGWRRIEIGDASAVRDRSLVLYPALRPQLGWTLAAQFGFRAQPTTSSEAFVVLLGRDATVGRAAQLKG